MPITLNGLPFDEKIISQLEKDLVSKGYDLLEFSIIKARRHNSAPSGFPLNTEYDYTVWIAEKHFSITFSDDTQFARFFYKLCCFSLEGSSLAPSNLLDRVIKKVEACAEATKHWLAESPLKKDDK